MSTPPTLMRSWSAVALLTLLGCLAPAAAADTPPWQPMLAKSFTAEVKDIGVTSLVVYRTPGCVFLRVDGERVYCSPAGANQFKLVTETWQEVCANAQKRTGDAKHRFVLTDRGIKESKDDGATWLEPISLPKDFVISSQTWIEYDATNDTLYLMKKGSDLYKLARGK